MLPSDNSWMYIIVQAQTLVLGYGITTRANPADRLLEYSRPVAAPQTFVDLYYGQTAQITDLESFIKTEWARFRMKLFSDKKLEWLDPKHNIDIEDLQHFIANVVVNYPYDTVKKVKPQFLPYTIENENLFAAIDAVPEKFLDEIRLDKRRKKV
jgi:hypothetical protein